MEHQLAELLDNSEDNDLTDLSFIKKASAFLVTQRIVSKSFIDYVQMAQELDNEILKNFVDQIVDRIVIKDGRIQSITFVNGLTHEFFIADLQNFLSAKNAAVVLDLPVAAVQEHFLLMVNVIRE